MRSFLHDVVLGIGPGRGTATLKAVDQLGLSSTAVGRLYDGGTLCSLLEIKPSSISFDNAEEITSRVRVHFVTPTELKSGHQIAATPEFGILMARIRDRLSTLSALYGAGPLQMDFADFGRRAAQVTMTRCDLTNVHATRLSTRTGQRHPLDGFTGVAEYEGRLGEFVPFLTAAQFAGVGRQTTWGKGEIAITALA